MNQTIRGCITKVHGA